MTDRDSLETRMKQYEGGERLMPLLPAFARLDGKAFHTFTCGMARPYDIGFCTLMWDTTRFLMEETNAVIGYTQSDEITLCWYSPEYKSQIFMDGKKAKMVSILAAMASVQFNKLLLGYFPERAKLNPIFDCRVWNVPTLDEAVNTLLWRELDATRNSIQSAGQANFSHKELQNKSCNEIQEMLHQKGVNWNDYPDYFKRGVYYRAITTTRPFTFDELKALPEKHEARKNTGLLVERRDIEQLDIPPLLRIQNKVDVLFNGQTPVFYAAGN